MMVFYSLCYVLLQASIIFIVVGRDQHLLRNGFKCMAIFIFRPTQKYAKVKLQQFFTTTCFNHLYKKMKLDSCIFILLETCNSKINASYSGKPFILYIHMI